MPARSIKVWNSTTSEWEDVAVASPDTSSFVQNSLIQNSKGALITSTGSAVQALTVGTNGQVLKANSATATGLEWAADAGGIEPTIFDAKGDLIVASAADTAARLAVGTNGHALLADSGAANGVKWGAVGKVLQVVSTTKTDTFSTTSGSFADITGLSATITPSSSSSTIVVLVSVQGATQTGTNRSMIRIDRGGTAIGVGDTAGSRVRASAAAFSNNSDDIDSMAVSVLDSPATTSATTYKVQMLTVGGGTVFVNRSATDSDSGSYARTASSITLIEVGP